jgi:hypothetical protein
MQSIFGVTNLPKPFMNYFCTYFDSNYASRGLALYQSLKKHCSAFRLWVLCLDGVVYNLITQLNFPDLIPIALPEFENGDDELSNAKQNRSLIEYYFTCTPSLLLYVLNNFSEVDLITYLDADLYFYSDPQPIFEEICEHSITIIEHRFQPQYQHKIIFGIYNVAWLSFRRDRNGHDCLNWWRDQCNLWCYDRLEDGKFADQKYLDHWPNLFSNVLVLQHKGANVAPWNVENYKIISNNGTIWIDDAPLVFYHFQGLKHLWGKIYDPGLYDQDAKLTKTILNRIYIPYLSHILNLERIYGQKKSINELKTARIIYERFQRYFSLCPQLFKIYKKSERTIRLYISKTYIILPSCRN